MAKNKSWFYLVKKLFVSENQPKKPAKKQKRWKWISGRLKTKKLATLTAPSNSKSKREEAEVEEDQSKQMALSMAIASTAAAEAAVAAAKAAIEVVWLTGTPQSNHHHHEQEEETEEFNSSFKALKMVSSSHHLHEHESQIHQLAAIRIQTAFRGYLARKALQALKGIVKLQAIIRGRAVRRQTIATLKCLQSIVSIQSQVCSNRLQTAETTFHSDEINQLQSLKDKIIKLDSKDQRWDDSLLSKEDSDAMFLSKREAVIRRERMKEYLFSHRRSAESERKEITGRWRYWLDQWVDTQISKSIELEDYYHHSIFTSNSKPKELDGFSIPAIPSKLNEAMEMSNQCSPKPPLKRLSHHRKQHSFGSGGGGDFTPGSPILPPYMAATESAKAKSRSSGSPKLRLDSSSADGNSPCKINTTIGGGGGGGGRNGKVGGGGGGCQQQQRSPGMKGISGPTRSSRLTVKDLSFDSENSLPIWDKQNEFR